MSELTDQSLQIKILSDPAALGEVRRKVELFACRMGFDADAAGKVTLAVDEALTNIIRHAYGDRADKPIEIELIDRAGELSITLRDYGCVVPKEKIHSRELDDVRPGGLGVYIISECMDCVEYQSAEGGGTLLVMKKRVTQREEQNNG
ncbi:MAG: ATP-binding protein [Phycisphaerae bacterium]|nr:ATP-binding protein [Phycisphaerae bacterium]